MQRETKFKRFVSWFPWFLLIWGPIIALWWIASPPPEDTPPKTQEEMIEGALGEIEPMMREILGNEYKPMSEEDKRLLIEDPRKYAAKIIAEANVRIEEVKREAEKIKR